MFHWDDLIQSLKPGDVIRPLTGASTLTIESVDENEICMRQRLWRACVTRTDFETASAIFAVAQPDIGAVQFGERVRQHYMSGHDVKTECSRVPNLVAVLLNHLGAFSSK